MTDAARDQTAEHEKLLLACALIGGPDVARELLALVQPPMIADVRLARAWSALRRVLAAATGPVDLIDALAAELGGEADEAPSLVELHGLTAMVLSSANATWYAAPRTLDAYVRRTARPAMIPRGRSGAQPRQSDEADLLAGCRGPAPATCSASCWPAPAPRPRWW